MPIKQGYEYRDGKRRGYYKWGDEGKKYYYTPGNDRSRKAAKTKARKQMKAAYGSGWSE